MDQIFLVGYPGILGRYSSNHTPEEAIFDQDEVNIDKDQSGLHLFKLQMNGKGEHI